MEPDAAPIHPPAFVKRLPLALFLIGCSLTLFQIFMAMAGAVGIILVLMQLVTSWLLLVLLGVPFGYQMHHAGNNRGLLLAFLAWVLVGVFNLVAIVTAWPTKLVLALNAPELVRMHDSLKPGEVRPAKRQFGLFKLKEVRKLDNGNTLFANDRPDVTAGLLYAPYNHPTGFNVGSCVQVSDKWYMVEED